MLIERAQEPANESLAFSPSPTIAQARQRSKNRDSRTMQTVAAIRRVVSQHPNGHTDAWVARAFQ